MCLAAGRAQHDGDLHPPGPVQGRPGRLRVQLQHQGGQGRLLLPVSPLRPLHASLLFHRLSQSLAQQHVLHPSGGWKGREGDAQTVEGC